MPRSIEYCENCGADLGGPVVKYAHDFITCGSQECEREARNQAAMEREEAHEQLDRDMGYGEY
jgi:hypothetical protein